MAEKRSVFCSILLFWNTKLAAIGARKLNMEKEYVVRVVNGNTLQTQQNPISLKLADVDIPEIDSPGDRAVQKLLEKILAGETVSVEQVSLDESGRPVANVWFGKLFINDLARSYFKLHTQKRDLAAD